MKIALIKQRTGYVGSVDRDAYAAKVKSVLDSGADVVVGPELALGNKDNLISTSDFFQYCATLKNCVRKGQLLVPGTALVVNDESKTLENIAPVIFSGKVINVRKRTSVSEENMAQYMDLEYVRGNSDEGVFDYEGKKVVVEICRDHAHAKLRNSGVRDSDLELVLACNFPGGIDPSKTTVKNGGLIIFNDGARQENSCVYRLENNKLQILSQVSRGDYDLISVN